MQIYVIKNTVNDKVYVGQSENAYDRFRRHRNNTKKSDKQNLKIIQAMKEIGINNFYFEILEVCDKEEADEREKYYIKKFDSFKNGYNNSIGGSGGSHITDEDIEMCKEMFLKGMLVLDIEAKTGINHKFLKRELMKRIPNYVEIARKNTTKAVAESKRRAVLQYDVDGNFIARHESIRDALKVVGKDGFKKSGNGISNCCKHRPSYQTAYGYKWEYDTQ